MMRVAHAALVASLVALLAPAGAAAQGNLSTQGLGFPSGQLSTPAIIMGGSIGESDPFSPLNPAAIALQLTPIIFFQAEPEYRQLHVGTQMLRSSVSRFPLFMGSTLLGSRWAVGLSASTLLDRTWETTTRDTQFVNNDTIASTVGNRSEGSIADVRLAVAYSMTRWLKVGVAGHALSGRDILTASHVFDDTLLFVRDTQRTTVGFGGNAMSVGVQTLWPRFGAVGVSYRFAGSLRTYDGDSVVASGSAPSHFGVSVLYLGIQGTTIAARASRDGWSGMMELATNLNVHEGWDVGVGADVTGPKLGSSPIGLRIGGRWRTLPFSASTMPVKERTLGGGFGFPMAGRRVELHLGAMRATRTSGDVTETAWTLSTGFAVRP